jgi:hypothetical protein
MATFKKKEFMKKFDKEIEEEENLDELIDDDGSIIDGDGNYVSNAEISTDTPPQGYEKADKDISQTTNDYFKNVGGSMSRWWDPRKSRGVN